MFNNPETLIPEITEALGLNKFSEIANVRDSRRGLWAAAKDALQPHINGEMPSIINATFPNEGADMLAWRQRIYRSKTQGLLQKAITGVRANVIEKITYDCEQRLAAYLNAARFKGMATDKALNFNEFMREFYYSARVKDPNAVIAIKQKPITQTEVTNEPDLQLEIYPSSDIVIKTNEMVIVQLPYSGGDNYTASYRFFGLYMQAVIYINKNSEAEIISIQPNDNGVCPVCFLGGAITTKEISKDAHIQTGLITFWGFNSTNPQLQVDYFSSDFAYAAPLMDETETTAQQAAVSRTYTSNPLMVCRELECGTCEGKGTIKKINQDGTFVLDEHNHLIQQVCPSCNGSGTKNPLSNGIITVPHSVDMHGELTNLNSIANGYVAYVSPPVQNTQQAEETADKCRKQLEDELNISATNFNFAQSAESKKEGRKQKEEQLKEIAASVARVYYFLLYNFSLFLSNAGRNNSRQQMIEAIKVNLPTQFIQVGADELEREFIAVQANLSNEQRDIERRTIMKNKKPALADKIDLYFNLCWELTNGAWLYTTTEILDLMATGVLTNEDKIKAIKLPPYIYGLIFIQNNSNYAQIERLAETFAQKQLANMQALGQPALNNPNEI